MKCFLAGTILIVALFCEHLKSGPSWGVEVLHEMHLTAVAIA